MRMYGPYYQPYTDSSTDGTTDSNTVGTSVLLTESPDTIFLRVLYVCTCTYEYGQLLSDYILTACCSW